MAELYREFARWGQPLEPVPGRVPGVGGFEVAPGGLFLDSSDSSKGDEEEEKGEEAEAEEVEEEVEEEGGEGEENPRKRVRGVGEWGRVVRCVPSGALAASGIGRPISQASVFVGEEPVVLTESQTAIGPRVRDPERWPQDIDRPPGY